VVWKKISVTLNNELGYMSRGLKNNNPGNIVKGGKAFEGEVIPSHDQRFRQFKSLAYGYRAMFVTFRTYRERYGLDTIRKVIGRWAPPVENDTARYVSFVARHAGLGADAVLDFDDRATMLKLAAAISQMENGERADADELESGWMLFTGKSD
jgi:hypothetical protein